MMYIVLLIFFISMVMVINLIYSAFYRKSSEEGIKKPFGKTCNSDTTKKEKFYKINAKVKIEAAFKRIINLFLMKSFRDKIDISLDKADIPLNSEEVLLLLFISSVFILLVSLKISGSIAVSIFTAGFSIWISKTLIVYKGRWRTQKINDQLGDAMNLMSGALRAGYSLMNAVEAVARDMPKPISKEFSRLVRETKLGLTVDDAFKNLAQRIPGDDIELLVTAVLIQRQTGGNLSVLFDNIYNTLYDRVKLAREVRTLSIQGKMSGFIVAVIPVGIAGFMMLTNPQYLKMLLSSRIGLAALIISLFNEFIGFLVIKRITSVRY